MHAFTKDILREIKNSFGRFISIMLIVMIGVAFFAGVKGSAEDMTKSADTYYDEQNLMDVRILSTLGLSENDVAALKEIDGVEGVEGTCTKDFITYKGTSQLVVKAIGYSSTDANDVDNINQVKLISGRYPENDHECLVESQKIRDYGYKEGDTITLKSGDSDQVSDSLKYDTYTIVGTCINPNYLSYDKGTSSIGSGSVDLFIMLPQSTFTYDYFTEIWVTVKGAKEINSYSDAYFDVVDKVTDKIEALSKTRKDARFNELKQEALDEWQEGYDTYLDSKETFESEIASAEKKLSDSKSELEDAQATLDANKKTYNKKIKDAENKIKTQETTLSSAETQVEEGKKALSEAKTQYNTLVATIASLQSQADTLKQAIDSGMLDSDTLVTYQTNYQTLIAQISALSTQEESASKQISESEKTIRASEAKITKGKEALSEAKKTLKTQKANATKKFEAAQEKIDSGWDSYNEGLETLNKNKTTGQNELDDALQTLKEAKQEIDDIEYPEWYILDRNSFYSYRDYESVADRMDGIGKVFPVFFLVVAALVCLTTMTRMVDEQRGTIGTYKALGYSKGQILVKYVVYAFIAGVIGSIIGLKVGMFIFPTVIFNAWNLMYNIPALVFAKQIPLELLASVSVIGVIIASAVAACYKELMDVPSNLMRPKAPKIGKKIFLEHIPFIWKRFSFTMKVTARNIFRYKKRFFMTIIGISGCTALLLAGFGIKDSIAQIVDIQYGILTKYDATAKLDSDASITSRRKEIEEISNYKYTDDILALTSVSASVEVDGDDQSITIMIPDNDDSLNNYITLRERVSKKKLTLRDDGAIISEKIATTLDLSKGDTITITIDDKDYNVKISGICENYVSHYLYMSPTYYHELTNKHVSENTVLIKMTDANDKTESALGNTFINDDEVSSLTFYRGVADNFADTIASLSFITYVLIGSAALLAFVVLYNLTNVNISERLREIATIKVLGFYDIEVASYVYRESIFLSFLGSIVGLGLGIILHRLIMNLAEMPTVMFGRNINGISFIYSIIITMCFSLFVNLVMYNKLKKIPMVESLKSVE